MSNNKANSVDENVLICYFKDLQNKVNPATLWSIWSMLKKMINLKNNIDINKYMNFKSFLKNKYKGYKPKKSLVFTSENVEQFLNTADDHIYLGAKVLNLYICL